MEVFFDKEVRETHQTERGNTRGGATKKARDFTHSFFHKSTLLSILPSKAALDASSLECSTHFLKAKYRARFIKAQIEIEL